MKPILVVLIGMLLVGCNAVYISSPIGTTPVNLHKQDWEGTWLHGDGSTVHVKILDGSNGVLKVGWVYSDSDDMEFQTMKAYLRESHGWVWANFEIPEGTNAHRYVWVNLLKYDKQVVGWAPSLEAFKGLVEDKVLPGEVDGDNSILGEDVLLGELSEQHLEMIIAWTNGLMEWNKPYAFYKLGPCPEDR